MQSSTILIYCIYRFIDNFIAVQAGRENNSFYLSTTANNFSLLVLLLRGLDDDDIHSRNFAFFPLRALPPSEPFRIILFFESFCSHDFHIYICPSTGRSKEFDQRNLMVGIIIKCTWTLNTAFAIVSYVGGY